MVRNDLDAYRTKLAMTLGTWRRGNLLWAALARAYSARHFGRLNGWWGNSAVALSYEGLAWVTGAAIVLGGLSHLVPSIIALLYSTGAHGIMTLNDFKSVKGDLKLGIRPCPLNSAGNAPPASPAYLCCFPTYRHCTAHELAAQPFRVRVACRGGAASLYETTPLRPQAPRSLVQRNRCITVCAGDDECRTWPRGWLT